MSEMEGLAHGPMPSKWQSRSLQSLSSVVPALSIEGKESTLKKKLSRERNSYSV